MSYNLTTLQGATDISTIVTFANDATNGILIGLFIFAFGIILFFGLKRYETTDALLASSWISFILSLIAVSVGWLNYNIMFMFLIMAAISLFLKFMSEGY